MGRNRVLWTLLFLGVFAIASQAATTTIDFNNGTPGLAIGNFYSGQGVTFTEGSWYDYSSVYVGYGLQVVSTSPVGWNPPFSPTAAVPITAVFSSAQSAISIDGLDVGFNGVELVALGATNNVLGFTTAYGVGSGAGNVVTLNVSAPGIFKAEWYEIGQVPGDGVLFDNLTFTGGSTTPEPSTWLMLASGVLGVGGVLRRKLML